MTRQGAKGGRTTPSRAERGPDDELPSIRARKPLTYWVVVIAVAAMALSVVAVPLSILLS